jgi:hypothetical protein
MRKLFACAAGAVFFLSACGGSDASDPADTSIVAVAETSVAASEPEPIDEAPSESVAAAVTPESTVSSGAAAPGSEDAVGAIASMLGVTDPKDLDCLKSKLSETPASTGDPAAAGVDPAVIRALLDCQPPGLVALAVQQLQPVLPTATKEQLECAAKASLSVVAKSPTLDVTALMAGPSAIPAELRGELLEKAKDCGLSADDLTKAFAG